MSEVLPCPFCGAPYPDCGPDCHNYKMAELALFTFGKEGGRNVPLAELHAAWNRRAPIASRQASITSDQRAGASPAPPESRCWADRTTGDETMNDDLQQQDAADEAAAHDFMERSVMCAEVTLSGATARAIARYISNLEVESDNDLAGVQASANELMETSEALVRQNAKLKAFLGEAVNILRDVSAEPLSEYRYDMIATFVKKHGGF